ncbi:hypothetical protein Taro_023915 [Colocasia esculenta]|uniref:Uncharacterized protein n=1 Tax=Colocasia esculenta TaxID=4460 RepID=A0A843V604_COLES|nr:hypothetical protein [Colocasia esculenta]
MREDTEVDCSVGSDICNPRFEEWDVDLEEIMVMEAIWQSLQDSKAWTNGTPEASGAGGGLVCGEKSEVNKSTPPCPSLGQCEASSSCACPLPGPVEDYASRLEASEPMRDGMQAGHERSCEDSADESDGTETDTDCLENFPYTEHYPSWRSARFVQDAHLRGSVQASAFATESFSSSAKAETGSCFSSYVHSDTSSSCDSPTFSNVGRGFPQLPVLLVEQPMMIVTESSV